MDYETLNNMSYLTYVMTESLRINPPVTLSTAFCMTEDIMIKDVMMKKNQMGVVNIAQLHYNPKEWQDRFSFIPERFDP